MLVFFFLSCLLAPTFATNCSDIVGCINIFGTNCGYCWDGELTVGQVTGGRPGNLDGPTDGKGPCGDWTWYALSCHKHVDCPSLPDCQNILGTYCGWCMDIGRALKGTELGPYVGKCNSWIWDHSKCPPFQGPQGIHLAYTDDSTIISVTWSTSQSGIPLVKYWPVDNPSQVHTVKGNTSLFKEYNDDGMQYIHRANMTSLKEDSRYEYMVSNDGLGSSRTFSFYVPKSPGSTGWVGKVTVFGDLGRHGGGYSLESIQNEAVNSDMHFALHVGDFAYDLQDNNGLNGDTFMTRIQNISARVPYMTCIGNHEDAQNGAHYRQRFTMPRWDSRQGLDMWYSFDFHLAHFVSYSSEVYFSFTSDIQTQLNWLDQDLAKANSRRQEFPWIIAFGHRPMYCSNADHDDCTLYEGKVREGLEELFHKHGVDIVIEAHEHSYERLWPVFNQTVTQKDYINPKAMVHLITGFAGCNENDGACLNPILKAAGPWSAYRSSAQGRYSYAHLEIHNRTHLYWNSYLVESKKVEDSIWVIQENHGPRNL